MEHTFYGREAARSVHPLPGIPLRSAEELFEVLLKLWCKETCAPRMRGDWTEDDPTLGQCSVTAFLCQDLFGGEVFGVPLGDGNYHCFNRVGDAVFDLTSEQFKDRPLEYSTKYPQQRETHFAKEEKYRRYLLLKEKLAARIGLGDA